MPKFCHSRRGDHVHYSARAAGFWRRFPFFWLPYFTGISPKRVHLTLHRHGDWWTQALLTVEPPWIQSGWFWGTETPTRVSDRGLVIPPIDPGQKWEADIQFLGPDNLRQPVDLTCYLELTTADGDKVGPLRIAEIPIRNGNDYTHWTFTTALAVAALVVAVLALLM